MPEITTTELGFMRGEALLLMPELAAITDPGTVTPTPDGGTVITGPTTTTGVPCRLARTGYQPTMLEFGAQLTADADYMLTAPVGTSIEVGWTVLINGVTYTVTAVGKVPTWGTAVRALIIQSSAVGG